MLATLLASFVLVACAGVFAYMDRTERALSGRYEDVQEFARCQATLRRAMQSLVAAYPQVASPGAGAATTSNAQTRAAESEFVGQGSASDEEPRNRGWRGNRGRTVPDDARAGSDPEGRSNSGASTGLQPGEEEDEEDGGRRRLLGADESEVPLGPEYFSMKPLHRADQERGAEVGDAPWRLELVLSAAPYAMSAEREGPVRGAFDIVQTDVDEWALLWTPITPPGEPAVLIDGLALALMAVLPRDSSDFTGNFGARQIREFPRAIRLILWTHGGAKTDWVFEPGIIEGVAP